MIIWLASYPRSGNHLLRAVLNHCFGLKSFEIYQPIARQNDSKVAALIGESKFEDETVGAFLSRARKSESIVLIKTHEPVPDDEKCIYIIRDPRGAIPSLQRYVQSFENKSAHLRDLVRGRYFPGSWKSNIEAFLNRPAKLTLILRYEDLASDTPPVEKIEAFIGVARIRPFTIPFSEFNRVDSNLFPLGQNSDGAKKIEAECPWTFWISCGPLMTSLGYVKAPRWSTMTIHAFIRNPARFIGTVLLPLIWPSAKRL